MNDYIVLQKSKQIHQMSFPTLRTCATLVPSMSKPQSFLQQIQKFPLSAIRHQPLARRSFRFAKRPNRQSAQNSEAHGGSALRYLLFAIGYALSASPAYAALDIGSTYPLATDRTLGDYITPLVSFAVVGAGVIAFLLFLGGGIAMIAGAGNPQQQEKGKAALTAGVIGLALVVSAYWIVQIVQVLTGINLLNPSL